MQRYSFLLSILLLGIIAIISQLLLIREWLNIFYGNELLIGIFLASWLIMTSTGSIVGGKLCARFALDINTFITLQSIISVYMPLSIILIRIVDTEKSLPGEIIGLTSIPLYLLILLPLCLLLGFQFSLGCKIATKKFNVQDKTSITSGKIYMLEALGFAGGGLFFQFLFINFSYPLKTAFLLSLIYLYTSFILLLSTNGSYSSKPLKMFIAITLITITFICFSPLCFTLAQSTIRFQWKNFRLITSKESIYGKLTVTREEEQFSFFQNSIYLFSTNDKYSSEEIAHWCMLNHPSPQKLLLIGGGIRGTLRELLQHPVKEISYVELDPQLVNLVTPFLLEADKNALSDPRIKKIFTDGRLVIKKCSSLFDVIICDLPSPYNAQLNRFYTLEFFTEVKSKLKPDGIFSFSIPSSESFLGQEMLLRNACIYNTLKQVFPSSTIISGQRNILLASPQAGTIFNNPNILINRKKERKLSTQYLTDFYINYRLTPQKQNFIQEILKQIPQTVINRDFIPVCYYYDLLLWISLFLKRGEKMHLADLFSALKYPILLLAGILALSLLLLQLRYKNLSLMVSTFSIGFAGMTLELVIILAFQVLYGYIYHQLGLIFSAFMMGSVLGILIINNRLLKQTTGNRFILLLLLTLLILFSLAIPPIIESCARYSQYTFLIIPIIFPLLVLLDGIAIGFFFPLALELYNEKGIAEKAGKIYGLDLIGASIGSSLTLTLLIPLLGIPSTCLLVAIILFFCLLLNLLYSSPKTKAENI